MTSAASFTRKSLTASEYVLALFAPTDNIAILVHNRRLGQTLHRITKAELIAAPEFQSVLLEQNQAGADIFVGMNSINDGACSRTKQSLKEIRHVYLDLDRNGDRALQIIRSSPGVPTPNFVLNTSPGKHQVVWRIEGITLEQAEAFLHSMANHFGGDLAATDATRVLLCLASPTERSSRSLSFRPSTKPTESIHSAISMSRKSHPKRPAILGTVTEVIDRPAIEANRNVTGLTRNVLSRAATIPKMSSAESRTTAATKSILPTPAIQSRKRKPIFRTNHSGILLDRRRMFPKTTLVVPMKAALPGPNPVPLQRRNLTFRIYDQHAASLTTDFRTPTGRWTRTIRRLPTEVCSRYRSADAREASEERNWHDGSILWSDRKSRKASQQLDCGLSLPESRRNEVAEKANNDLPH